jgi:hypothetical protein
MTTTVVNSAGEYVYIHTAYSSVYTVFDKHSDHNLLLAAVNVSCVCYVLC